MQSNSTDTPSTQKQLEDDELDKILDWHNKVILEAYIETMKTRDEPEVVITAALLDKHRANAKAKLNSLLAQAEQRGRIDEIKHKYTLDLALMSSPDYKRGFQDALDQIDKADAVRIAELQANKKEQV